MHCEGKVWHLQFINTHLHSPRISTICVAPSSRQLSGCSEAEELAREFTQLFGLFQACHGIYYSRHQLKDEEIKPFCKSIGGVSKTRVICTLFSTGSNIKLFMSFYRSHFPEATVLPKMHMLENHMIPWLEQMHVGMGLMGEQGAESIHAAFNHTERQYTNMPEKVERWNAWWQSTTNNSALPCGQRARFKAQTQKEENFMTFVLLSNPKCIL